ncbi:MAG: hypothetical protein H6607_11355 [Flavobacteriales bacterium]|nr:hypothetical protein [Flavobacteriales bacterium]
MKKLLIISLLFTLFAHAKGQDTISRDTVSSPKTMQIDSVELRFGMLLCDSLSELADSIFSALKTKKFEALMPYIPTTDILKEHFDTIELNQLQRLADIKYQVMVRSLQKDHFKMNKYAKAMHYNLKTMELIKRRISTKKGESGTEYAEITYLCKSGKYTFYITFLAVEMVNRWFIADQLQIVEL